MAFARYYQHVSLVSHGDGQADGGASVGLDDNPCPLRFTDGEHSFEHLSEYGQGILRAGVVTGEDRQVGEAGSGGTHERPLGAVPVATAAKHDGQAAAGDLGADWRATDVRAGADGSTFRIVGPGGVEADASIALPGPYNVANALGAVVALVESGVHLATAVAGVAACPGVPGRMERVDAGQDFTVLVDYSHKPGAVRAVLDALRPVTPVTSRSSWAAAVTGTGPSAR